MESYSCEFAGLCTFESFKRNWPHYGFDTDQRELIQREFTRIKDITYLDHAGTTLFPESQIRNFYEDISRNVYGNPHSHNPSSRLTHDTVENVRYRILQHFNTSPEEYSVIFTAGCTAALKLVADSFPWVSAHGNCSGSQFCYLTDNHTSVVGIRGVTGPKGVETVPVSPQELEARAKNNQTSVSTGHECSVPHLFCYPAQSNFSGRKYPLSYVRGVQSQRLFPACERRGRWFVLLDAACFAGCSPLDLKQHPADFVPISFYKMFGFPTGLGALLVRNEAAELLRKGYFGGGTAAAYLVGEDYFVPNSNVVSRFEDGTISFLDVISLHHGFDTLHKLTGSMVNIQLHTFGLARYTYIMLSCLRHSNEQPVAQIYCDNEFESAAEQGAVLNFNLLDCHGRVVGYSQVDKMACLFSVHMRTGCFCNTGACQAHLGISNQEVKRNLQVTEWPVVLQGLLYDRTWMVVNENGVCLSQKREPKLCLIHPHICLASSTLRLQAPGMDPIALPLEASEENLVLRKCQSKVCGDRVQAVDCGERASVWLSQFLGKPCCLIRQNPDFSRDMKMGQEQGLCPPALSLVNEAQFLLINRASVALLLDHIVNKHDGSQNGTSFDMLQLLHRFRANLVISGLEPFEEEDWSNVKIGGALFQVAGKCGRCQMIGIDQASGTRTQEPLRSLSECRNGKVTFGIYLLHLPKRNPSTYPALSVGSHVIAQTEKSAN